MGLPVAPGHLMLPDTETVADLTVLVRRALRLDGEGAARLSVHGGVLAVYVAALHGSGVPTVLGLRTLRLAEPALADVTVPLTALADRLARLSGSPASGPAKLDLPALTAASASWAGLLPPRSGWSLEGLVEPSLLRQVAAEGIAQVAAGTPAVAGAAAVAKLRAGVWGRDLAEGSQVPAGAAFAAEALGFLGDESVSLHRSGSWWRLSLLRGHVLARRPALI